MSVHFASNIHSHADVHLFNTLKFSHFTTVYSLAHDLLPLDATIHPTLTHSFISLLHEKRLLSMCLTQNVDSLELRAGVPPSRLLEAHGTFRTARCAVCKKEYDGKRWKEDVREERIPKCENVKCGGTVKPDVVLFGEQAGRFFCDFAFKLF